MKNLLSLSVRIAEGFLSKEEAILSLDEVCQLATDAGYQGLCLRASQIGVQHSPEEQTQAVATLSQHALPVTMMTGDFATVYNNEAGPDCLRRITPYLDLAERLGTQLIRVALKKQDDIKAVQRAADEAAERNLTLVHQCHTLSLFETVDSILDTVSKIDRQNFGIIYEPANLEICGQPYKAPTIERLAPWIKNVYLQNQVIKPGGAITLDTWCRGPVSFDLIPVHQSGGIDYKSVFADLHRIDYQGPVTVHQSAQPGAGPLETAKQSADFLHVLMETTGAASE